MAEGRLPCGKCGATILVPDQYPYASIACAYCGAVADVHSRMQQPNYAQPLPPYPQQPAYLPIPPGTSQYPFDYAPPVAEKSGGRGWIAALIVVAVVLLAGGAVAALSWWAPVLKNSRDVPLDEWILHRDVEGRFEVRVPRVPKKSEQKTGGWPNQRTVYSIGCNANDMLFEVSYFDLNRYEAGNFDYTGAVSAAAEMYGGSVRRQQAHSIAGHRGWRAEIALANKRVATLMLFVAGQRVYVLACANHVDKPVPAKDYFFENFALIKDEYEGGHDASIDDIRAEGPEAPEIWDGPEAPKVVLTALENDRGAKVGAPWNVKLEASAGTAPYTWSVDSLPPGVHSIVVGDELRLSGSPRQAGYFTVVVTVRDKNQTLATAQFPMRVHE